MKHSWVFSLILGGVVGAFAVIVSTDPAGDAGSEAQVPRPPAQVAVASSDPGATTEAGSLALDPSLDDEALARELERAHFDRDWGRAAAVGAVLRERRRVGPDLVVEATGAPRPGPSLVRLDHDYRRATYERELQLRQNPATRLVRQTGPGDDGDVERRLVALFQAPPVRPEDAQVRADAALLLGRLGTEGARQALREALAGADEGSSRLAALALARADDPAATDVLLSLLESDNDPVLRARVADALAESADLIDGASSVPAALARVAAGDRDLGVRTHALATLARADLAEQPSSRAALARLVTSETEDVVVRQAAVAALRAHHAIARGLPPDLLEALLSAVDRTTGDLRLEVIAALGEAATASALPQLDASALAATDPREGQALRDAALAIRTRSPE